MPFCANCGTETESSWRVCSNCGSQLETENTINSSHQGSSSPSPTLQYSQPTYQSQQQGYFLKSGNYGTPALILGILGLIGPIFFRLILLVCPVALVFGILGLIKDENKAKSVIGMILGAFGTLFLIFGRFYLF